MNIYGFDYGHLSVVRLFEHEGMVGVRVLNKVNGHYIDVGTSRKGRKLFASSGHLDKDELARWLASNGGVL